MRRVAARGGNVAPQSALHSLHGVRTATRGVVRDTAEVADRIVAHFEEKWRVLDEAGREALGTFLAQRHACPVAWPTTAVCAAVDRLRRPDAVDTAGLCGSIVQIAAAVCPEAVAHAVRSVADSDEELRATEVRGVPLGKKTSTPTVERVRMLLPLCTMMPVVDILIADELHAVCNAAPSVPGFLEGAVPGAGRSASDLSLFARLFVEKGLDDASRGAVLQSDVAAFYYDNIDVVRALLVAQAMGAQPALVAAAARHQLLPRIVLATAGSDGAHVRSRTRGALTGSRTAGALGRFVVREMALHVRATRPSAAVLLPDVGPAALATYVDNLLIIAPDASVAEATLESCREFLSRAWGLLLPDDATEILVPRGAAITPTRREAVARMRFLGHTLDSSASCLPCFRAARDIVLARAQAQMRVAQRARVPVSDRVRALDTVLYPILGYRAASWAPSSQLMGLANSLQRRCAALAVDVRSYLGEDRAAYRRPVGRIAAIALVHARPWASRVLEALDCTLRRLRAEAPSERTWAGAMLRTRDAAWIAERRIEQGSLSVHAGRIGARVVPGRAAPRFEETICAAPLGWDTHLSTRAFVSAVQAARRFSV